MGMQLKQASKCLIITMILIASVHTVLASEEIRNKGQSDFEIKCRKQAALLQKASTIELQAILDSPVGCEIGLETLLEKPEYSFPGEMEALVLDTLNKGAATSLSEEERLHCLSVLASTVKLAETNGQAILEWFAKRKDKDMPSLLDALVTFAVMNADLRQVAEKDRIIWRTLLQAKNPMCRLVTVKKARTWATESEMSNVVVIALADPYYNTRSLGLDYLSFLPYKDAERLVKDYLMRTKTLAKTGKDKETEERLKRYADMILERLLKEQSKINGPNK